MTQSEIDGLFAAGGLATFMGFFAILFIVFMLLSIGMYVFQAFALMKISENVGFDKGWLAWIPIANGFVMPMLVENDTLTHRDIRGRFTLVYAISLGGSLLLSWLIPFVSLIPAVLMYYAFFIIAKWFSDNYLAHFLIAIFTLGFSLPVSLFMFRNRTKRNFDENGNIISEDAQFEEAETVE